MTGPEDELMTRLGEAARDRAGEEDDEVWEQLAAGLLPPERLAELERQAAGSPEIALRLRTFRPLDAGFKDRVARGLGAPAAPVPVRPRRAARWVGAAAGLALAAGLLVMVSRPPPSALPAYTLSAQGDSALRGDPQAPSQPLTLSPSSRVQLLLRPAQPVDGEVAARLYTSTGGVPAQWDAPLERSPEGALRLSAPASAIPRGGDRPTALLVFVGRPGALPSSPAEAARLAEPGAALPASLQAFQVELRWTAD